MAKIANVKDWLLEAEQITDERITAIVIGPHGHYDRAPHPQQNKVLSRKKGLAILDETFKNHGVAGCYAIIAWSKTWVYYLREYDGRVALTWHPRHPTNYEAEFN